ncbi:MAG: quinol:cytochrome C oxidoreductase [Cyclobacteriaceae bacterium]|nr:quinol:cytochrome C oxidoreductase [Cyclobacteriaceae bacterium]
MAAHAHDSHIADERYIFKPQTKRTLLIVLVVGLALFALGVILAMNSGHGHDDHATSRAATALTASADQHGAADTHAADEHAHHGTAPWLKRIYTSLWHNNIFFVGIGIIGLFFIAIQYAAQAGWSAPIKRIPLALGHWMPIGGLIMIALFFVAGHDLFHWTHGYLYDKNHAEYDAIIDGKAPYFFWPMAAGSFPVFYVVRMVAFFGLWYMFFTWIKREMLAEDLSGGTNHWYKMRKYSAIFLVIFGFSSSIGAWDWVMSIDTHWYSTMFGWYVFASWWVTGLATITLIVVNLKDAGYLKMVNSNHLHDLGKFVFAFSIFWTYIWFGQFLLIYYAHIPEETIYFVQRMKNAPYSWVFYANLLLNFVLPFLLLMTRDAKRQMSMLKVVCPIVIVGHWFDFYNMVTPGVMQQNGGVGFLEIGLALTFLAAFLWVVLTALSKVQLVAKNHPFMAESLNHHI